MKYYGLSCFTVKSGASTLVTDPFSPKDVGLSLPQLETDAVVYTEGREVVLEGAKERIVPAPARVENGKRMLEIFEPGEYEVGEIFIRVLSRPEIILITAQDVTVGYLGLRKEIDLKASFDDVGMVDYLIVPVGDSGLFPEWTQVDELIENIGPGIVIPSCYRLDRMKEPYTRLLSLSDLSGNLGEYRTEKKLKLTPVSITEESQYEIVALQPG